MFWLQRAALQSDMNDSDRAWFIATVCSAPTNWNGRLRRNNKVPSLWPKGGLITGNTGHFLLYQPWQADKPFLAHKFIWKGICLDFRLNFLVSCVFYCYVICTATLTKTLTNLKVAFTVSADDFSDPSLSKQLPRKQPPQTASVNTDITDGPSVQLQLVFDFPKNADPQRKVVFPRLIRAPLPEMFC